MMIDLVLVGRGRLRYGYDYDFTEIPNCNSEGSAREASPQSPAALAGGGERGSHHTGAGTATQNVERRAQRHVQDRHPGKEGSSVKILMDSSGWIEFFTGGPLAERYAAYLTPRYDIITPTIV